MATPMSCHQLPVAVAAQHEDADHERQELHQLQDRVHEQHPRVEPAPRAAARRPGGMPGRRRRREGRVVQAASARSVSAAVSGGCSLTWRPRPRLRYDGSGRRPAGRPPACRSSLICSGPAADAVVTVTEASPSSRPIALCSKSTVCTRDIGAIRRSRESQPGLGVDGRVGALPAVDPVAHPRHPDDVGDRDHGVHRPHPDRHVEPVEDLRCDQHREQDAAMRIAAPNAHSTGALVETWWAGSRSSRVARRRGWVPGIGGQGSVTVPP